MGGRGAGSGGGKAIGYVIKGGKSGDIRIYSVAGSKSSLRYESRSGTDIRTSKIGLKGIVKNAQANGRTVEKITKKSEQAYRTAIESRKKNLSNELAGTTRDTRYLARRTRLQDRAQKYGRPDSRHGF